MSLALRLSGYKVLSYFRGWLVLCRSLELVRDFTEEAHSIALHPSGYNLLVGFTDKLRLFAVLVDSLKCVSANPAPM